MLSLRLTYLQNSDYLLTCPFVHHLIRYDMAVPIYLLPSLPIAPKLCGKEGKWDDAAPNVILKVNVTRANTNIITE